MPCRDKRNNKPEENVENESVGGSSTMDRIYHDSETFLYRYRWWIVLVLAILLGYHLYCKKSVGSKSASGSSSVGEPRLGKADLNLAEPTNDFNTEARNLFRL